MNPALRYSKVAWKRTPYPKLHAAPCRRAWKTFATCRAGKGNRVDTIPNKIPYLSVPEELKRKWAGRLAAVEPPRVGLVWAGRKENPKDSLRSVRLEKFSPLLDVTGIRFFSLQKGEAAGQIE